MTVDPPNVPLSALEHHEYCPRQAALIHVEGLWRDNAHTVRGRAGHQRADHAPDRHERGRQVLRGVDVWSHRYHLTGRCDTVEVHADGQLVPVEYKIGTRHGRAAEVQLRAQGLCLAEMTGTPIDHGYVWYATHQRRHRIPFDSALTEATHTAIAAVRATLEQRTLPAAPADHRCDACQLNALCLPEIVSDPQRVQRHLSHCYA